MLSCAVIVSAVVAAPYIDVDAAIVAAVVVVTVVAVVAVIKYAAAVVLPATAVAVAAAVFVVAAVDATPIAAFICENVCVSSVNFMLSSGSVCRALMNLSNVQLRFTYRAVYCIGWHVELVYNNLTRGWAW